MLNQSRASQIAERIQHLVANTTARPESIEALGKQVIDAVQEFDDTIGTVLEQRRRIVTLMEPFYSLYQSVADQKLLDALPALSQLKEDPTDLDARLLTTETMSIASEMWEELGFEDEKLISLGDLVKELKEYAAEEKITIPWSNPGAVVSTILTRSGNWERVTPRQYRRIGGSYGLFR